MIGNFLARRFQPASANSVASPWLGMSSYGWGGETLDIFHLDVPDALLGTKLTLQVGERPGSYTLSDEDGNLLLQSAGNAVAKGGGATLQVGVLRANPGTRFVVRKWRTLNVISELQEAVKTAELGKDSGILKLTYEDQDPVKAENILQHIAQAYVRQNVDRNSAEASSQLQFVKEQLPNVRKQVEAAQAALSAYQTRENSVDITLQTQGLLDQAVAVETSIQELRLKQAEMDRSYTRAHPAYRALMKQIGELESRKKGFQDEVKNLPDTQQELLKLTRDMQVGNELYTALLNQAQQLDVARAGTVGNVRIVDPAAVDVTTPVAPRKALVVAIGVLLGGLLSVGYVLLQRMLNPGIEDPAQIEAIGLPVYAAIPLSPVRDLLELRHHGRPDGRQHLLAINNPADPTVEALRSLRTSLHFAMLEAKNNIIVISGPRPEVGKTFVSANLAVVIAQAGQRVLIIDADMRKGSLHRVLGSTPSKGLSDVLVGKLDPAAATRQLAGVENLHYMVRGEIPPNPSELLMHSNFTRLLEALAPQYDLLIIDTPPILAVTDAAIVARHAGSNLLVTRFGMNQPKEIVLTKKRFEQNGVQVKGAIFNAVERRATGYYSYGYYEYKSGSGTRA